MIWAGTILTLLFVFQYMMLRNYCSTVILDLVIQLICAHDSAPLSNKSLLQTTVENVEFICDCKDDANDDGDEEVEDQDEENDKNDDDVVNEDDNNDDKDDENDVDELKKLAEGI